MMRTAVIAAGVCLSMLEPCVAQTSTTTPPRFQTQILPQALGSALKQFETLDHIHVLYLTADVSNLRTSGATGNLTADEALTSLLNGTGLTFRHLDGNAVSIVRDYSNAGVRPQRSKATERINRAEAAHDPEAATASPEEDPPRLSQEIEQQRSAARHQAALTEVVVTGTRIPGSPPVGVSVQTIDSTQIRDSGVTTVDQLMQSLPDAFRGGSEGATPDNEFQRGANHGSNFAGGSGVDLRGLGSGATLVLFNGHRLPESASGYFTDISNIPLQAIDHIDILTDGASAIYGSDAVAGVVNIVPKQQTDGLTTSARYGAASGLSRFDANTEFGRAWDSGGISLDADYAGEGSLDVRDRSFTSSVRSPTSIFPMYHTAWVSAVGHQQVGDRVDVLTDLEYSDARRQSVFSANLPAEQNFLSVPRWSGSVSADYRADSSWTMSASYSAGEGVERVNANSFISGTPQFLDSVREAERSSETTVKVNGDLFSLPGGSVKLATGASYLVQSFSHVNYTPLVVNRYGAARYVTSGYGEVRIPIVSRANAVPGIAEFTVALAGRRDRYSDFGATTNYKVGASWHPGHDLQFRGAYSTSFRAPAVGTELVDSERGTTAALLFPILNPLGTANIPVIFLEGAKPHLQPETATNLTVGLDYFPSAVPKAQLSINYYDIRYIGQLAQAPFEFNGLSDPAIASAITQYPNSSEVQALVSSALAAGAQYVDATAGKFGANPLASTLYTYDIRTSNLSVTNTSGFDLGARYRFTVDRSALSVNFDATYIRGFFTQLTPNAPTLEEVNTVGFPAALKFTAGAAITRGRFQAALRGNYVQGYKDSTSKPEGRVGSFTTVDLFCSYRQPDQRVGSGETEISVAATNLFNRDPPFVQNGALSVLGSHYDAANASPLGRMISLEIARHW